MNVAAFPATLACGVFAAAMLHAALTDLRSRRIRNWLVAALAVAWVPLAIAAGLSPGQMGWSLLAAAVVFAGGFGCFCAGWLGGGDVKLASATVLWLGAGQALPFLVLTALLGAVLSLLLLALRRLGPFAVGGRVEAAAIPREVPYGLALALAGIGLLNDSPWIAAL
jgi:prepilin peptidase CpaA